jgi:O-antigen/teichoic acid export membrane protein
MISRLAHAYGALGLNVAARIAALASAFVATLVLAHQDGAAVVGLYALLHVIPGLVGTLVSAGLPGAVAYFLAGPRRSDRRLPATIVAVAAAAGGAGSVLWVVAAPSFASAVFSGLSTGAVAGAGALVATRLLVTTAKACSQGSDDLRGAAGVIFTEEFMFLPSYAAVWFAGGRGGAAVVLALLVADVATGTLAWQRLVRCGFFRGASTPSRTLARELASYGTRAQVGTIISQLNLRLDFVVVSVVTGPTALGVYAVASKFAELVRVITMALTYVLYPAFARDGPVQARRHARRLLTKGGVLTVACVAPLMVAAGTIIPAIYGDAFGGAVRPAQIILAGLALDGAGAVATAYLLGVGRPGRNSAALGVGLVATLALDFLLIPPFGITGAATASAVAYTTATLTLIVFFRRDGRRTRIDSRGASFEEAGPAPRDARGARSWV